MSLKGHRGDIFLKLKARLSVSFLLLLFSFMITLKIFPFLVIFNIMRWVSLCDGKAEGVDFRDLYI